MDIFVGNLLFEAAPEDVKKLFEGFGNVSSAVIVMENEKKAPKSRGFGFVQMPDEQQALAAIAALHGKEFMGRVINVKPVCPKTKAERQSEIKKKMSLRPVGLHLALTDKQVRPVGLHLALADKQVRPIGRPGAYKGGRRTHSYMKRRGFIGIQAEVKPRQGNRDNPMRWRKKKDQAKPLGKSNKFINSLRKTNV